MQAFGPLPRTRASSCCATDRPAVADRLATVGCPLVIVPWMPEEDRRTADDVRRFAAELGEFAKRLAERGMQLGYHNHAFEFEPLDCATVWDVLLAELPPEVQLELDVYWAAVGRARPTRAHPSDAGPHPPAAHEGPGGRFRAA